MQAIHGSPAVNLTHSLLTLGDRANHYANNVPLEYVK